jgi:hypothetical protein
MRRLLGALVAGLLICGTGAHAQVHATLPAAPLPAPNVPKPHRFWDSTNKALFAGVVAARTLDYTSTRHFRARGANEWLLTNRIVDNRPLLVGLEVAGTAASIGISYWLHRKGHHRLERWISAVHIGVGVGASIRNYTLGRPTPPGVLP